MKRHYSHKSSVDDERYAYKADGLIKMTPEECSEGDVLILERSRIT
jgi:hypothetical protein